MGPQLIARTVTSISWQAIARQAISPQLLRCSRHRFALDESTTRLSFIIQLAIARTRRRDPSKMRLTVMGLGLD